MLVTSVRIVWDLYNEAHRRQDIRRRHLQAVENWVRETGVAGARQVSGAECIQAHAIYESCGYMGQKLQKNYRKLF